MYPDDIGFGPRERRGGPRARRGPGEHPGHPGHPESADSPDRTERPERRERPEHHGPPENHGFEEHGRGHAHPGSDGADFDGRSFGDPEFDGHGPEFGGPGFDRRGPGGRGFGGPGGPGFGPRGPRGGRGRGRGRGRRPRGDVRTAVLLLLSEEPMHGYQLMQTIDERTGGSWSVSPGAIYPTLSQLEDEGFVEMSKEGGRKLATLTDAGTAHVAENRASWSDPFAGEDDSFAQGAQDLRSSLRDLTGAVREATRSGEAQHMGQVAGVLTEAKRSIYRILAGDIPTSSSDAKAVDQTDAQTGGQTGGQTDGKTDGQTA